MIKRTSRILIISLLILSASLLPAASNAQVIDRLYVPQTGHWIMNDFLAKYQSVPNPEEIFGYPITEAFINQTTGHLIQYFERALFELHPEKAPELPVENKRLGDFLYQKGEVVPIPMKSLGCQYFPETNHQVCYAFLEFFKNHGGIAQFGYPISEIEIQDGRYVQYFQRVCFEWHPDQAPGKRVILAELGRLYFDTVHEDPQRLRPSNDSTLIRTILNLQVRAFPKTAVMALRGNQAIYVIVQDQNLVPVPNATVLMTIKYPSGMEDARTLVTDENGIAVIPFLVDQQISGSVEVNVKVSTSSLEQTTRTSFRLWW